MVIVVFLEPSVQLLCTWGFIMLCLYNLYILEIFHTKKTWKKYLCFYDTTDKNLFFKEIRKCILAKIKITAISLRDKLLLVFGDQQPQMVV